MEDCSLVADTEYEYKVVKDHNWDTAWPTSNAKLTVGKDGSYTICFIFYSDTEELFAIASASVAGSETGSTEGGKTDNLFGTSWDVTSNDMTIQEDGIYKLTKNGVSLKQGTVAFKIALNHLWNESYPATNYELSIPEDGTYNCEFTFNPYTKEVKATANKFESVAKIGSTYYPTLQEAINAAEAGTTIDILKDFTLTTVTTSPSEKYNVNIDKSVTINGNNHVITGSEGKRSIILMGDGKNITFKDLTLKNNNSESCLWIGDAVNATLDNVTLDGTKGKAYNQPLTIGQFDSENRVSLNITNGSVIKTNDAGTAHYSIIAWHPADITVTGSKLIGWANVYLKPAAAGSTVKIDGSEMKSQGLSGSSNNFAIIVTEGNGNTIEVKDTKIEGAAVEGTNQSLFRLGGKDNVLKFLGSTTYETNDMTWGCVTYEPGSAEINKIYFDETTKTAFAKYFAEEGGARISETADETGLYPLNYVSEVYYYWVADGVEDGGNYNLAQPFVNGWLDDGEFIRLKKDVTLASNLTWAKENASFTMTFGDFKVTKGEYSIALKQDVTVNTDKQTDIFSAVDEGYKVVETAVEGGYQYTVAQKEYVAQIGEEQKYYSLAEAFEAATDGQTITVLTDIDLPSTIAVTKQVTLDLDGKTISNTSDLWVGGNWSFFSVQANGNLTVTGNGTIDAKENDCFTFDVRDGGILTIKDGTYTGNISSVYLINEAGTGVSTCNIEGGTFSIKQLDETGGYNFLLNCRDASYTSNTAKFNVTGGSFVNFNPANNLAEGAETNFCAAGYEAVQDGNVWTVQRIAVAKIGETLYYSLAEAVAAVPTDGAETTITMIADEAIDVVGYAVTIATNQNVVLDLAGHTVEGLCATGKTSALIRNLGTLKIEDSSDTNKDGSGNGKLTMSADPYWVYSEQDPGGYASNLIRNEKNLTIESGHLYNTGKGSATYGIDNYSAGNITINGGKVDAAKASAIRMFYVNGGSITVNEGVVGHYNSDDDCTYMGLQVQNGTNANVTITGGTIAGNYAFYANNTGGNISISDGTFDGYVAFGSAGPSDISITGGAFNAWVGTWGNQTKFISGGIYASDDVDKDYIADGFILTNNTDPETMGAYPYAVRQAHYIAAIGDTKYETLADAVKAAGTAETTITLLTEAATDGVISGDGVVVPTGSNITFDLNGLTYDVSGKTVGSSGTENQGFQLLKNSNITFKNGTLKATSPTAQFIIQNYSNLTLEDVNLDGTGLSGMAYALSNNCGTINLTGSTSITAKEGGRAFDTCKFGSYAIPTVNINTTGVISGPIEATGGKLNIENGKFDVTWVTDSHYAAGDIQIKGGVFSDEPAEEYLAENYVVTENKDATTSSDYPYAVKTKEDAGIFELVDTDEAYPYPDGIAANKVTYTRSFSSSQKDKHQPWFVPFDYTVTEEDKENFTFYKIHMIAASGTQGAEVHNNELVYIYIEPVEVGTVLKGNRPYLVKPSKEMTDHVFVADNITELYAKDTSSRLHHETTEFEYDFYGQYNKTTWVEKNQVLFMSGGKIVWNSGNNKIGTYRWYIKATAKNNGGYAKPSIEIVTVDANDGVATDLRSISSDDDNIEGIYTISGVKVDRPVKGVNIIRYKDGSTKKINVRKK